MSLYDKASLIFSGAAGAGNEEVAYNIKPVEKLKVDEYVKNGNFDDDSVWTKTAGVTISGGKARMSDTSDVFRAIVQQDVFTIGKTYKVSVNLEIKKGTVKIGTELKSNSIAVGVKSGQHSFYFTADANDLSIAKDDAANGYDIAIDNVSVREVEQKANDFSFVRASDLTATYEGADGLIKKTVANGLQYTNDFSVANSDGGWVKNNASVSYGFGGHDGESDAWKFQSTTGTSYNNINQGANVNSIAAYGDKIATFSVYVKKGNTNWIRLNLNGTGNVYFDLDGDGAVGTESSQYVRGKIEKIGTSGWFRCSITRLGAGTFTGVYVYLAASDGNLLASDHSESKHILVQKAQLEYGSVPTKYVERTAAAHSTAGIREDEPRYDYSLDNDAPPALLYEPERKNYVVYSEEFAPTDWNIASATKNSTFTYMPDEVAPTGLKGVWKYTADTSGDQLGIVPSGALSIGDTVTNSIFVKRAGGQSTITISFRDINNQVASTHTLTDADGWKRITATGTCDGTPSVARRHYLNLGTANDAILVWGAQQEDGECVTSYIPTYGSAATRKRETIPQYTPSKTNLDKYTFFAHSHSDRVASDNRAPRLKGNGNSSLMGHFVTGAGKKQFFLYDNESNSALSKHTFGSFTAGDDTKYAFVVDNIALEAKLFIDGLLRETISLTERVDAKILSVGNSDGNPDRIKSIMYFPEALEDDDVRDLTSLS